MPPPIHACSGARYPRHQMPRDFAKLHFVVILWGFTAILGQLIGLESIVLVSYRVGLAGLMLAALIAVAKIPGPGSGRARALLLANGLLLGLPKMLGSVSSFAKAFSMRGANFSCAYAAAEAWIIRSSSDN